VLSRIVFEFAIPLHPGFLTLLILEIPDETKLVQQPNSLGVNQPFVPPCPLSTYPTGQCGVFFPARLDIAVTESLLERLQFSEPCIPRRVETLQTARRHRGSKGFQSQARAAEVNTICESAVIESFAAPFLLANVTNQF